MHWKNSSRFYYCELWCARQVIIPNDTIYIYIYIMHLLNRCRYYNMVFIVSVLVYGFDFTRCVRWIRPSNNCFYLIVILTIYSESYCMIIVIIVRIHIMVSGTDLRFKRPEKLWAPLRKHYFWKKKKDYGISYWTLIIGLGTIFVERKYLNPLPNNIITVDVS